MSDRLPVWLKHGVRTTFEPLEIGECSVSLDVSRRGIAPFWRGWWLIDVAVSGGGDPTYIEIELRGDVTKGRKTVAKVPISSGRSNKRLVYADWRLKEIVIQPSANGGLFSVQRLTIAPALHSFAVRHIKAFLAQGSRDLRGRPLRDVDALLAVEQTGEVLSREHRLYRAYSEAVDAHIIGGQVLYQRWIRLVEPQLFDSHFADDVEGPTVSVVMPVHNPLEAHLRSAIESVIAQTYRKWELCIVDDASEQPHVRTVIEAFCAHDNRIRAIFDDRHGHISATSNRALGMATGNFVTFLDHDDELAPQALNEVVCELARQPQLDIIYSDEDFIDPSGCRRAPHFKSDWNPYLLYSHNYVTHLCVYRRSLVEQAGGMRIGVEGAQDYDLLLRCARLINPERIFHIPKILYHWRMSETSTAVDASRKNYTHAAGAKALRDYFAASGDPVSVESIGSENFYRVNWTVSGPQPLVTLVVPTRDQVGYLARCIDGLLNRTAYLDTEILIIDNGSTEAPTLQYLDAIGKNSRVRIEKFDEPFNFARICNFAARRARGEILAFVNNDVDVINSDWLDEMVMLAARPDIGCVGAKLLYEDGSIQHAGVVLGLGGYAAHAHRCFPRDSGGYFNRLKVRQNVSAVTAACLVVRRSVYLQVGGMDEVLSVAYNDVDFGLKLIDAGFRNVFTPFAQLYHFESKTRGYEDTAEKQARFQREKNYLAGKWGDRIRIDPYYNPNLTHAREDFTIGF